MVGNTVQVKERPGESRPIEEGQEGRSSTRIARVTGVGPLTTDHNLSLDTEG